MERIYLLNSVYCSVCSYNDNIKPAISPYYTLDKYFGTLSIEEFDNCQIPIIRQGTHL